MMRQETPQSHPSLLPPGKIMIQDYILSFGSILFVIALIPSIRAKDKPALSTSLMTAVVLTVFALTYLSLKFWFATFSTSLTAVCWYILAWQKFTFKNIKN